MKKFTIAALVLVCVVSVIGNEIHSRSVTDVVSAGSYKYYILKQAGLIKIHLISESGDADLYISQINTEPTYQPKTFCLQSVTCGDDIVYIPSYFRRPITVGVYGHPSHESSHYKLLINQQIDFDKRHFRLVDSLISIIRGIWKWFYEYFNHKSSVFSMFFYFLSLFE